MICLHYLVQTSVDLMKENGLTLKKQRCKRYPAETINYSDYLASVSLLHSLEQAAKHIGFYATLDKKKKEYSCVLIEIVPFFIL